MKLLYLKDFYFKPKNWHIDDENTRTLSVFFLPRKFGFSIEIMYGITLHLAFFEINYLE